VAQGDQQLYGCQACCCSCHLQSQGGSNERQKVRGLLDFLRAGGYTLQDGLGGRVESLRAFNHIRCVACGMAKQRDC
jgi:hypothetical protein